MNNICCLSNLQTTKSARGTPQIEHAKVRRFSRNPQKNIRNLHNIESMPPSHNLHLLQRQDSSTLPSLFLHECNPADANRHHDWISCLTPGPIAHWCRRPMPSTPWPPTPFPSTAPMRVTTHGCRLSAPTCTCSVFCCAVPLHFTPH